ncbi:MAG: excinuclease ABC subunit UvrA [Bryobacterales bacterium]|nr:excinuclease ABC subunit UvrA [Bryobacterales bacterium]
MLEHIVLRGARLHNLKGIDLEIPHNRITVVTGVSGSGKSSLVFDTIYAEGQRRYVESLSAYARQFLERMERPEVDEIDGLAPPIAIRQKNQTRNPRSTVATSTEIYDFLRLLYARVGRTYCPNCGNRVQRDTVDLVADRVLQQPAGSRWYLLFPVKIAGKADPRKLRDRLFDLRKRGFTRLYQAGATFEFSTPESLLGIDFDKDLFVLVDRLVIDPAERGRIVDGIEIAYRESGEVVFEESGGSGSKRQTFNRIRFSEAFTCKHCDAGIVFVDPEPRLFSFNNPFGACPRCQGFGNVIDYDLGLVIPDDTLTLQQGAVHPWSRPQYRWWFTELKRQAKGHVRLDVSFQQLSKEEKDFIIKGAPGFPGIRGFFEEVETKKYKVQVRAFLSRYRGYSACPDCGGSRLRPEALHLRILGNTIADVVRMNIREALDFFDELQLTPEEAGIATRILVEIRQRLRFLNDVGLEYLTLDRLANTLSGGEAQRIQLATCLGSRLVGACYILDEPSIGLHTRDTLRLIRILEDLRDLGNTVIVVEHDADVMRASDYLVDLGPGAGENGGAVMFAGASRDLFAEGARSLTARYLRGELRVARPLPPPKPKKAKPGTPSKPELQSARGALRILGARKHNLKNIDVEIPLGKLVALTGVSGSGKSTLMHDVLFQSLRSLGLGGKAAHKARSDEMEEGDDAQFRQACRAVEGLSGLEDVILVDQSPIGRTPRSNPVTYIKAFDHIRDLFASTALARKRHFAPGYFSFNVPGGRCEVCQGDGTVTVEMQFLADVELTCEECKGTRFKDAVLEVEYNGLNIHQVLGLTVDEAIAFFSDVPRLVNKLCVLQEVGLGYLRLGQSATTLSGGEAQRIKLAAHMGQASCAKTLFLFDEPTTGLHFDDIAKLLAAFDRLLENGGSVLVIEHNLDIIRNADWIIDLGPEGGIGGGSLVVAGPPEAIAEAEESYTGRFLKPLLCSAAS